jgi:hypothetical protein
MRRPKLIIVASLLAAAGAGSVLWLWAGPRNSFHLKLFSVGENPDLTRSLSVELDLSLDRAHNEAMHRMSGRNIVFRLGRRCVPLIGDPER